MKANRFPSTALWRWQADSGVPRNTCRSELPTVAVTASD